MQVNQITNYKVNLSPLSPKRQNELTKVVVEFIVNDVQPLHILQNLSFHRMLLEFQPQYQILCASMVKRFISEGYHKGINQFKEILVSTADIVHLTTNLWTAKSKHGYLVITATWLTPEFEFREALLSCHHMPYPHNGINISEELFNILYEWNLESKVCMIITDNGSNMVKEIELLKNNRIESVFRQPCAAHTLQLSVGERLKQIKSVHQRLKSI